MALSGGGRPAAYKTKDGKRVPGVTTVVGRFKDSGGLIQWAWKIGLEGGDINAVRDQAGGIGKMCHGWIDDEVHGRPLTEFRDATPEDLTAAANGLDAFRTWRSQVSLEILSTETPYVSEAMRVGGTYDAIGLVHGKASLIDWKTSGRIYPEYVIQLAAYREIVRECTGEELDGAHLLRVGKEFGDFHYHFFPPAILDVGLEAFRGMRKLYELDAVLKKVA